MNDYHLIQRAISPLLEDLLAQFPIVVVTGARQTGKSTLVQQIPSAHHRIYKTLDDLSLLERAVHSPEVVTAEKESMTLDEVQRAPNLLLAIKKAVDQNRIPGQFLLTGSANLLLMKKVSESLAGRAVYLVLHPMTQREKQEESRLASHIWTLITQEDTEKIPQEIKNLKKGSFSWESSCLQGGYPRCVLAQSHEERLRWMESYIQTYLERDIQQLSEISQFTDFRRLMLISAQRAGQILNQAGLARDAGISPASAYRYLNLLEIGYQIERISAFFVNRTKRLIKAPKLYWGDTGLLCFLGNITSEKDLSQSNQSGAILENWVLRQMDVWREITSPRPQIHYWRTASGEEVDFVIEWKGRLFPIEVKMTKQIYSKDIRHIQSFMTEYAAESKLGFMIYTGDEVEWVSKNILAIPTSLI